MRGTKSPCSLLLKSHDPTRHLLKDGYLQQVDGRVVQKRSDGGRILLLKFAEQAILCIARAGNASAGAFHTILPSLHHPY